MSNARVAERLWSGRTLDNRMVSQPALFTDEPAINFEEDAKRGSEKLLRALFRAAGYNMEEPKRVPPRPVFKPVKIHQTRRPRGRPKGQCKARVYNLNVVRIMGLVCERYGLTTEDLLGRKRARQFSVPRHVAMYLARKLEGQSYPDIGHQFGGRDHTTILSACHDVETRIEAREVEILEAIQFVRERLGK